MVSDALGAVGRWIRAVARAVARAVTSRYALVGAVTFVVVVAAGWLLTFDRDVYEPVEGAMGALATLEPGEQPDARVTEQRADDRDGTLLVDTLHVNRVVGELEPLLAHVSRLGFDVEFERQADDEPPDPQREAVLREALGRADAYLVVSPRRVEFTTGEVEAVREFVEQGGRVLLAADATEPESTMGSLAGGLGIHYEHDYLYNVVEFATNYRNVVFRDFADDPVTEGLSEIVLYTASSIRGAVEPLVWADENTRSSTRLAGQTLAPVVLGMDGQVVAVGDARFLTSPRSETLDNDTLLANLADFLTRAERDRTAEEPSDDEDDDVPDEPDADDEQQDGDGQDGEDGAVIIVP